MSKTQPLPLVCLLLAALTVAVAVGCSSTTKSPYQAPVNASDDAVSEQRKAVEAAENALQSMNFVSSEELFAQFIRRYPVSVYSAQAHYGRARSLEALGRLPEAIQIYRSLGEQAQIVAPDRAAMAYLRLSYCYEAMGDEARLMAALADAERLADAKAGTLSDEARTIEIPARQAASMMRRGQNNEARAILRKIEKSLPDVSPESSSELRDRHAKLLVAMGTLQLQGVNADNYLPTLDTFQALQIFLWKAVLLKSNPSSEMALERLSHGYTLFANLAFDPPQAQNGQSDAAATRLRADLQRRWVARLLESIQELKIYSDANLSQAGEAFTSLIGQIEEGSRKVLWGRSTTNPLTEESKALTTPRREGRVVSEPVFDSERKPVSTEKKESAKPDEDPNLQKKESP